MIVETTVPHGDLTTGWNTIELRPSLLEAGKRYAWFTVTTGNHALQIVTGNKFAQGSLFWRTDGAWAQGSPTEDFCFRVYGAKFEATRVEVEMAPLSIAGGMTEIDILHAGWVPAGTEINWRYMPAGETVWYPFDPVHADLLDGTPESCRLQAVFVGTTDLMPAIVMDSVARVRYGRLDNDMTAVSHDKDFGLSTTEIETDVVFDNFDDAIHTASPSIIVDGVTVQPDITTIDLETYPGRRRLLSSYTLGAATTSARLKVESNTTQIYNPTFVQNVSVHAL